MKIVITKVEFIPVVIRHSKNFLQISLVLCYTLSYLLTFLLAIVGSIIVYAAVKLLLLHHSLRENAG